MNVYTCESAFIYSIDINTNVCCTNQCKAGIIIIILLLLVPGQTCWAEMEQAVHCRLASP